MISDDWNKESTALYILKLIDHASKMYEHVLTCHAKTNHNFLCGLHALDTSALRE